MVTPALLLPTEILCKVLSFVSTKQDLGKCSLVCRHFNATVCDCPELWEAVAIRTFSFDVAHATIDLYYGQWKDMVKDDNRRGAMPTLAVNKLCHYRFNRDDYYFICLVVCLKWDRDARIVRIYLDARGEVDLRHPATSSLLVATLDRNSDFVALSDWTDEMERPRPGHYKGYLTTRDNTFSELTRSITFIYANAQRFGFRADYEAIDLCGSDFDCRTWNNYTLKDVSPFRNDNPQVERERWQTHIPTTVLERSHSHLGNVNWWTEA